MSETIVTERQIPEFPEPVESALGYRLEPVVGEAQAAKAAGVDEAVAIYASDLVAGEREKSEPRRAAQVDVRAPAVGRADRAELVSVEKQKVKITDYTAVDPTNGVPLEMKVPQRDR